MGFTWKGLGRKVKKVGKGIGKAWEKVDDVVLPAVGFALGGPAGAALGAAGARGIGDGKFNAKATLKAGALGYAGGQLGQMAGLQGGKGFGALKNSLPGLGTRGGATTAAANMAGGAAPAAASIGTGGGMGGILRSAGGFVRDNPDLILGGVQMLGASRQQAKSDDLAKQALGMERQRYEDMAPLRTIGMQGVTNTARPDLSGVGYADASNPFARPLRPLAPSMGATTPPGPQAANFADRPLRRVTRPRRILGERL